MKTVHPYRALLALFGRDLHPALRKGGKEVTPTELGGYERAVLQWFRGQMQLGNTRQELYGEYDAMDRDDIVAAALDLYAEDATQVDTGTGKAFWVESKNKEISRLINEYLDRIGMEDIIQRIARGLAKYGDHFEAILTGLNKEGRPVKVMGLEFRPPHVMSRVEDEYGRLKGFVVSPDIQTVTDLDLSSVKNKDLSTPWDFIHYRILARAENKEDARYGTSLIRAARRVYKRLIMMEDAITIYRMRRAPDRLKWIIDTGDAPPMEALEIINEFKQELRMKMLMNPETGELHQEIDPLGLNEDIFVPKTKESMTDVSMLRGTTRVGEVLDLEYMRKRLFSCLRIPPDYMGFSDASGTLTGRSPLSDQDVQFARQEKRLQKGVITGNILLIKIELILRGIDPERPDNEFKARMCPVSFLDELQRAEVVKVRANIVETLLGVGKKIGVDQKTWLPYVLRVSGFSEEVSALVSEVVKDTKGPLTESQRKALMEALVVEQKTLRGGVLASSAVPLKWSDTPNNWRVLLAEAKEKRTSPKKEKGKK